MQSKFSENCRYFFNPLSANPTKCSNILKQFSGNLLTNCLSVFDHFHFHFWSSWGNYLTLFMHPLVLFTWEAQICIILVYIKLVLGRTGSFFSTPTRKAHPETDPEYTWKFCQLSDIVSMLYLTWMYFWLKIIIFTLIVSNRKGFRPNCRCKFIS